MNRLKIVLAALVIIWAGTFGSILLMRKARLQSVINDVNAPTQGDMDFITDYPKLCEDPLYKLAANTSKPIQTRVSAAELLSTLPTTTVSSKLLALTYDASPEIRARAAELLGDTGEVNMLDRLHELSTDPSAEVRLASDKGACQLLGPYKGPVTDKDLLHPPNANASPKRKLNATRDESELVSQIMSLDWLLDDVDKTKLCSLAVSGTPKERSAALWIGSELFVREMSSACRLATSDPNSGIRLQALSALERLDNRKAQSVAVRLKTDADVNVRKLAKSIVTDFGISDSRCDPPKWIMPQ